MSIGSQPAISPRASAASRAGGGAWLLPGLVAIGTGLLMAFVAARVRVPGEGDAAPTHRGEVPELAVTRMDRLPAGGEVREYLKLMDPARLFLPFGQAADPTGIAEGIVDRPGGGVTEPFPATLTYRDLRPARGILLAASPASPVAAMDAASEARWFQGMPRSGEPKELAAEAVGTTAATMEVYAVGAETPVAAISVKSDSILESNSWRPMELRVFVNSAGPIATPVLTAGSGVGEVDEQVRVLVTRELLPRLRLRPGAYRLVVGP